MAGVPSSSVFALQTRRYKMYREVHFIPCLRLIFARALYVQNGHGCPGIHATATFLLRKNSHPEVYTDVHFWTGYFQKAYGKLYTSYHYY
ncbi:hypothetical protein JO41_01420 [Treponema sp. OMZ 838]|nr:hypothetical protein JO41_01420 [Treponema sp. OMZ 838]